jgi:hypothetical protein
MTIARLYRMTDGEGQADALLRAPLPKEAMAAVVAALAGRPEGSYLDYR